MGDGERTLLSLPPQGEIDTYQEQPQKVKGVINQLSCSGIMSVACLRNSQIMGFSEA
jgi:hypothetical protein